MKMNASSLNKSIHIFPNKVLLMPNFWTVV